MANSVGPRQRINTDLLNKFQGKKADEPKGPVGRGQQLNSERVDLFKQQSMVYSSGMGVSVQKEPPVQAEAVAPVVQKLMEKPPLPPRNPPKPEAKEMVTRDITRIESSDAGCCACLFSCCFGN